MSQKVVLCLHVKKWSALGSDQVLQLHECPVAVLKFTWDKRPSLSCRIILCVFGCQSPWTHPLNASWEAQSLESPTLPLIHQEPLSLPWPGSLTPVCSHSAMSESLWPHGLQPTRLLWDSPGKKTGEGCHFLLLISRQGLLSWIWAYNAKLSLFLPLQEIPWIFNSLHIFPQLCIALTWMSPSSLWMNEISEARSQALTSWI